MRAFSLSDIGPVRKENQDCCDVRVFHRPHTVLMTVCDGMGGANSGALASFLALETYQNRMTSFLRAERNQPKPLSEWMRLACDAANLTVFRKSSMESQHLGMGTTLVSAVIIGRRAEILHVGDSRAYLIRKSGIEQLTRDHSLVEEMLESGMITPEEAEHHPQKNMITRAVGVCETVQADVTLVSLSAGDRLLLCSDGLSNSLSAEEMLTISRRGLRPAAICRELVERACANGARDNVTAAIAIL